MSWGWGRNWNWNWNWNWNRLLPWNWFRDETTYDGSISEYRSVEGLDYGAWEKPKWQWSNLLPWNWFKKTKYEPTGVVPDEYKPITVNEATMLVSSSEDGTDAILMITEPITDVLGDLKIATRFKPTDIKLFNLYLLRDNTLVHKSQKSQLMFSGFGTNKDFLSWMFGQSKQNTYRLYIGDSSRWYKLSFTGGFYYNRVYRAVKDNGDVYIIVTNMPFTKHFVQPSQRMAEIVKHIVDRSDLSVPSKNNPVPANSVLSNY